MGEGAICCSFLPPHRGFDGESYRGRENSYTGPSTTELNGVDSGLGPARAWVACERASARASVRGEVPACWIRRLQACIDSTAALFSSEIKS
jgi:hypothetical protein